MWVQPHAFLEGIRELVPASATNPYKPGCSAFALALGTLEQAETLLRTIMRESE